MSKWLDAFTLKHLEPQKEIMKKILQKITDKIYETSEDDLYEYYHIANLTYVGDDLKPSSLKKDIKRLVKKNYYKDIIMTKLVDQLQKNGIDINIDSLLED
jgi:hypothetical protein